MKKLVLVIATMLLLGLLGGSLFATTMVSANPCEEQVVIVAPNQAPTQSGTSNTQTSNQTTKFAQQCFQANATGGSGGPGGPGGLFGSGGPGGAGGTANANNIGVINQ